MELLETPAPKTSMAPNLAVSPDGAVFLSWLEKGEGKAYALRYARLASPKSQWSSPTTILTRDDLFLNWADFPSLLPTQSGRLLVHWLQMSGMGEYSYDIRIAQSGDDGRTWTESRILHDDGLEAEHGFVSLLASPAGDIEAIWLDGRTTVPPHEPPQMQLGFTTISPSGEPRATQLLDSRICDCCQTSAAWTAAGPVVAYRDRSQDEVRDISILRRINGKWTEPARVHADNWQIEGCPVNGPSIAARENIVAVAWFTGAEDKERVYLAFSADAGATFSDPIQIDDGRPVGRVGVDLSPSGDARVVWVERTGETEEAEVRLRTVTRQGGRSDPIGVAAISAARKSGFPRLAAVGEDLLVAWTEVSDTTQVRVARVGVAR